MPEFMAISRSIRHSVKKNAAISRLWLAPRRFMDLPDDLGQPVHLFQQQVQAFIDVPEKCEREDRDAQLFPFVHARPLRVKLGCCSTNSTRRRAGAPHTPAPRSPGPTGPPQASSAIHSVPTGARELDGRFSRNVPGKTEIIGAESLPAVGAGAGGP